MTPGNSAGKVQGYQAFMRGGGMFLGMVVAGFLFYRWEPLPFILNGLLIMVFTYLTVAKIGEPEPEKVFRPAAPGDLGGDQAHLAIHHGEQADTPVHGRHASCGSRRSPACGPS